MSWNSKTLRLSVAWLWIAVITLVVYRDSFTAPFIFDDWGSAAGNPNIESLSPLWKTFVTHKATTLTGRPLVSFSLALNRTISGDAVWSYHVFNALTHLACALLLLLLLVRAFASNAAPARLRPHAELLAVSVTLVWAIHPLLSESVINIVQRTELMVTFFYLATIYCTVRAFETPTDQRLARRLWFALGIAACALGMMCKEVMISAPIAALLYNRVFLHGSWRDSLRKSWPYFAALASTTLILIAILITAPRGKTVGFSLGIHWLDYLYTQAWVLAHYLTLCFVPSPLSIIYDVPLTQHLADAALPGVFILLAIALTIRGIILGRAGAVAGAIFFMVLAPSSSVVPIITEVAAERRMYLPLAMVLALVAGAAFNSITWAHEKWPRLGSPIFAAVAAVLTIAVIFAIETDSRTRDYRTPEIVWRDAVAKAPGHPIPWNNLGGVLAAHGQYREAAGCYLRSSQLHSAIPVVFPNFLPPKASYARMLTHMGDAENARRIAKEVLDQTPAATQP